VGGWGGGGVTLTTLSTAQASGMRAEMMLATKSSHPLSLRAGASLVKVETKRSALSALLLLFCCSMEGCGSLFVRSTDHSF